MTHSHSVGKLTFTYDSWQIFLEKCKPDLVNSNPSYCVEKYLDKCVYNWEGYVLRIKDYRENMLSFYSHAVEIFVKMEPSESNPDIFLTFDSHEASYFSGVFNELQRGQKIVFNGTIKSFGDLKKGRHIHGINIIAKDEKIEIDQELIGKGRYGVLRKRGQK